MKTFLTKILPLLLPALVYLAWLYHARRRATSAGGSMPAPMRDAPWSLLVLTGLVALVFGILMIAVQGGEDPGGTYVPPKFEDGQLTPGHIER